MYVMWEKNNAKKIPQILHGKLFTRCTNETINDIFIISCDYNINNVSQLYNNGMSCSKYEK